MGTFCRFTCRYRSICEACEIGPCWFSKMTHIQVFRLMAEKGTKFAVSIIHHPDVEIIENSTISF